MKPAASYTRLQRRLHWLVVAMLLLQYLLHDLMVGAMATLEQDASISAMGFLVITVHTWGGAAIGLLVIYRLQLRRQRPVVVAAGTLEPRAARLAGAVHVVLYLLLLFMVLTGASNYYFGWHSAARWHELGTWILAGLILVHTLGALWHHFIRKDAVLQQMLGSRRHTDTMAD